MINDACIRLGFNSKHADLELRLTPDGIVVRCLSGTETPISEAELRAILELARMIRAGCGS